jgi:hypothetical protein
MLELLRSRCKQSARTESDRWEHYLSINYSLTAADATTYCDSCDSTSTGSLFVSASPTSRNSRSGSYLDSKKDNGGDRKSEGFQKNQMLLGSSDNVNDSGRFPHLPMSIGYCTYIQLFSILVTRSRSIFVHL